MANPNYNDPYAPQAVNPVKGVQGVTTEYAAAGLVIGALVALFLIRRGFGFGVGIPGVASVNVGR